MHQLKLYGTWHGKRIITQLGQCADVREEKEIIDYYRNEKNVDNAFDDLKKFWEEYLSYLQVETPDENFNTMVNIHNPRQCYITKNWSRYLSLYQMGLGARGIGFRDSSQDVLGVMGHIPEEGRELIEKLLQVQKRDGSKRINLILTMIANEGSRDGRSSQILRTSMDYTGCFSLSEGNRKHGFLDTIIPFADKDKKDRPIESKRSLH